MGDVLAKVAKIINRDNTDYELVIDRDTTGVPGSPNIADTIFNKIENSDIFVADVSIINPPQPGAKATPNPNVLIELGYAFGVLGDGRVLMVMNSAFNIPDEHKESPKNVLPFDLGLKRVIPYELTSRDDPRKDEVRESLVGRLAHQVTEMLATPRTDKRVRKVLADVPRVSFVTGGGSSAGGGRQTADAILICTHGVARSVTLGSNSGQIAHASLIRDSSNYCHIQFSFPSMKSSLELFAEYSDELGFDYRVEQTFEWFAPERPRMKPGLAIFRRDGADRWEKIHDSRPPKS
ncbi:MAG: nucleotide-binding protein [Planctomycetota bacterium]|nr:nucleotide-binding protein [Planctomycetota bacterium]